MATLKTKRPPRVYRCDACGRKLKRLRWIYSRYTHAKYCWPGEGCNR